MTPECPCCLGDPDTVCDACGQHSCWAGIFMCWESATAGTCTAVEYARRDGDPAVTATCHDPTAGQPPRHPARPT